MKHKSYWFGRASDVPMIIDQLSDLGIRADMIRGFDEFLRDESAYIRNDGQFELCICEFEGVYSWSFGRVG